jgi:hypothetical protein
MATLHGNLDKVVRHGKRADAIVKNMLLLRAKARVSTGLSISMPSSKKALNSYFIKFPESPTDVPSNALRINAALAQADWFTLERFRQLVLAFTITNLRFIFGRPCRYQDLGLSLPAAAATNAMTALGCHLVFFGRAYSVRFLIPLRHGLPSASA